MTERKASNKQYFESISREGGGGDMKLKMKMLKCSKFDDLERKNMRLNKPPLYESRSCAVERSENLPVTVKEESDEPLQVTVNTPTAFDKSRSATKNLNNLNSCKSSTKTFVRTSSLKLVIVPTVKESSGSELYPKRNVHRGTCSSTQKETRFPKTLELDPGGTDAEGISVMNVCSYRYCSLNGHRHEALPPLKSFSTRKRSVKTEKKMKALIEKSKRENDRGQPVLSNDPSELSIKPVIEEEGVDDFFVEIYAEYEQITEKEGFDSRSEEGKDEKENFQYDVVECVNNELVYDDEREGVDQSSELLIEEMDVMIDVLEYIERDQSVEEVEEEKQQSFQEDQMNCSMYEAIECDSEDEIDDYPDNTSDGSEYIDDGLGVMHEPSRNNADDGNLFSSNSVNNAFTMTCEIAPVSQEVHKDEGREMCNLDLSCKETASDASNALLEDQRNENMPNFIDLSSDSKGYLLLEHGTKASSEIGEKKIGTEEVEVTDLNNLLELFNKNIGGEENKEKQETKRQEQDNIDEVDAIKDSDQSHNESCSNGKTRIIIVRKKINEEIEVMREFNPRPPSFLPVEPDQEMEKVCLRQQKTVERKNAEEWMIDYALRKAVMKLALTGKTKVALLVEAFETVMPFRAQACS